MSQTTKFFIVLGFLWIIYVTIKGHLANYLQLIFAECNASGSNTVSSASSPLGSISNGLAVGSAALQNGEKLIGYGTNEDGSTYPQFGNVTGN